MHPAGQCLRLCPRPRGQVCRIQPERNTHAVIGSGSPRGSCRRAAGPPSGRRAGRSPLQGSRPQRPIQRQAQPPNGEHPGLRTAPVPPRGLYLTFPRMLGLRPSLPTAMAAACCAIFAHPARSHSLIAIRSRTLYGSMHSVGVDDVSSSCHGLVRLHQAPDSGPHPARKLSLVTRPLVPLQPGQPGAPPSPHGAPDETSAVVDVAKHVADAWFTSDPGASPASRRAQRGLPWAALEAAGQLYSQPAVAGTADAASVTLIVILVGPRRPRRRGSCRAAAA